MKKQVKLLVEVGDANYVAPGEYFAEFSADGRTILSISQRQDDLSLKSIVSTTLALEDNKAATANAATFEVTPTSGKDAMKKVTATVTIKLFSWKDGSNNIAYTLKETPAANDTCYLAAATGLDDDKVKAYAEGKITVTVSAADVEFSRNSAGDITL